MSKAEWKTSQLDELGFVGRGRSRHRPRNDARLYGGPYPFIQTAEIMRADPYITSYSQTYTEFGLQQSKLWPPNTLCITIAGANTAETAILKFEACFPDSIIGFIPDLKKADLHFVKYSLDLMKEKFRAVTRGATQDNLSLNKLLSFPLQMPPLFIQRRIAGILSAYDKLIENNQQRIKILEEMARSLYREWFVHFRFPGHDKIKMLSSPLGPTPKGWEVTKVGSVFKTLLGGTPSRAMTEYWQNGTVPWINSGKVNELRIIEPSEFITELALEKSAAKIMPCGTTVIAITGATLGQVSYLEINTTANQSVIGIVDETGRFSEWLYLMFKERIHEIILHASGGAQQHINKEIVSDVQIVIPPIKLAARFKCLLRPMFSQLATLMFKTQKLRRTHDILLPRLLSGQMSLQNREVENG